MSIRVSRLTPSTAQDLVTGQTAYSPLEKTTPRLYSQPDYVARLLTQIAKANPALRVESTPAAPSTVISPSGVYIVSRGVLSEDKKFIATTLVSKTSKQQLASPVVPENAHDSALSLNMDNSTSVTNFPERCTEAVDLLCREFDSIGTDSPYEQARQQDSNMF